MVVTAALLSLIAACAQISGALSRDDQSAARQAQEFLPDGGPPVVNGYYEAQDACPFEGCQLGDLLATAPIDLRGEPNRAAPIVAAVSAGEWVSVGRSIDRFRPVRGIVVAAHEVQAYERTIRLEAGDVIYVLDSYGEGFHLLWRRGDTWQGEPNDDGDAIRYEWPSNQQRAADDAASAGWWIEVRRDNGESGWVLGGEGLGCLGAIDESETCRLGRGAAPPAAAVVDAPSLVCAAHDISPQCQELRSRAEPLPATYPRPRPFRDCPDCPSMVWIPGQAFAASQYEVTFAEWDACVAGGGCNGAAPSDEGWGRGRRPVMNVLWDDAQAYVQWLSRHTGQRYRLLTTDEWTAAAFPGGRRQNYYWGNATPVCEPGARNGVAYDVCGQGGTLPVGTFQPNAYGLYDVIGNVGEWLQDDYAPGDGRHAIIGSSWASDEASLGGRGGGWSHDRGPDTGIRVARER